MPDFLVIGGGIAGLAAAYELFREGQDFILIEENDYFGGKVKTIEREGFIIEGGPDCFLSEKPQVFQIARELKFEDKIIGTNDEFKGTYILSGGRLHELPEGLMMMVPTRIIPFALSPLISWPGKIRMGMDLFIPRKRDDEDESLYSFVTRRLGREALEKIAEPLIGGIHAGTPEEMSVKASFPRFVEMEKKYGSLIRGMLAAKKASSNRPKTKSNTTYFMSFQKGMGELAENIVKNLPDYKLFTGKKAVKVTYQKGKYRTYLTDGEIIESKHVILAVPAYNAAELLEEINKDLAELLAQTGFASSATITLAYRKEDWPFKVNTFGFVVPRIEKRHLMALTYSSVKWSYRVPDDSYLLVRGFLGGATNQNDVFLPEKEMVELVLAEIKDILGVTAKPLFYEIFRWPRGMAQYKVGHLERLAKIEELVFEMPGLALAGSSYRGIGVPDCIKSGREAVRNLLNK
ncbi:protoporphyrinogen oxidase [Carboxydothermus hydrogenoformans]|uniref:Coproporphyrinogen III oxidase n=1 Tax=Carboxydothermus hydrogenoformans (strain ATCC BAA-161 / DSM 6008 / Z-2901) TaxID=246194 RepID=Q3AEU5_CARHZ|nr:protoporphyrinogen oxidase [Carboxydothermus hydrogenoformans]ABB15155.1 protoporphyrinogen oxidase [Carboxydothermus hydrogenoformans Z-2901]